MTAPRNRVRGIAELPAARVENSPGNWRTHDAVQKEKMRGLLGEVGSVSELVVWVPDDQAREALRRLPGPDGFAAWLSTFTGKVSSAAPLTSWRSRRATSRSPWNAPPERGSRRGGSGEEHLVHPAR